MRRGVSTGLAVGMRGRQRSRFGFLRDCTRTPRPAPASSGAERDLSAAPADDPPSSGPCCWPDAEERC